MKYRYFSGERSAWDPQFSMDTPKSQSQHTASTHRSSGKGASHAPTASHAPSTLQSKQQQPMIKAWPSWRDSQQNPQATMSIRQRWPIALGIIAITAAPLIGPWRSLAQAEPEIDDATLTQYAQIVLDIEVVRRAAYDQALDLMKGGEVPVAICSDTDTIAALPREVRSVATAYCNQAKQSIEAAGMTVEVFDQVTAAIAVDEALQQQIQTTLLELQAPESDPNVPTPP